MRLKYVFEAYHFPLKTDCLQLRSLTKTNQRRYFNLRRFPEFWKAPFCPNFKMREAPICLNFENRRHFNLFTRTYTSFILKFGEIGALQNSENRLKIRRDWSLPFGEIEVPRNLHVNYF